MIRSLVFLLSAICFCSSVHCKEELWPGFVDSGYNNEQVREICSLRMRAIVVAPGVGEFDPERPTLFVIFKPLLTATLPNKRWVAN